MRSHRDRSGERRLSRRSVLRTGAAVFGAASAARAVGTSAKWDEREDTTTYKVVVNDEEQYSIWPAHRENPLGWHDAGFQGDKRACLAYIEEVWTDMRPKSLRDRMADSDQDYRVAQ
jgi:MbtH protein